MNYEKVVIGSCLDAILYACSKDLPLLYQDTHSPLFFEHFPPDYDFPFLSANPQKTSWKINSLNSQKTVGLKKNILCKYLLFFHAMEGRVLFSGIDKNIHVNTKNKLEVYFSNSTKNIYFDELVVFEPSQFSSGENLFRLTEEKEYLLDYLKLIKGQESFENVDFIENDERPDRIYFINSKRNNKKDIVCVTQEEEKEFPELKAHLKTEKIVKNICDNARVDPWYRKHRVISREYNVINEQENINYIKDLSYDELEEIHFNSLFSKYFYNPKTLSYYV